MKMDLANVGSVQTRQRREEPDDLPSSLLMTREPKEHR